MGTTASKVTASPGGSGLNVVVAVDESHISLDTLRWAANQVLSPQDTLHLVTVLDTAHSNQVNIVEAAPIADKSVKQCVAEPGALEYTTRFLEKLKSDVLSHEKASVGSVKLTPIVSCANSSTDIGRAVIDYAQREKCDAILVGSRGLGNFRRTMLGMLGLGSVSDYVIKHSPVTVMVHKNPTMVAA